jgi:hypothetical protein
MIDKRSGASHDRGANMSRSRFRLALIAPAALSAALGGMAVSLNASTAVAMTRLGETADPLIGRWDTGRISAQKLRSALRSAGYTNAAVSRLFRDFGIRKAQEYRFTFYREGGVPFLLGQAWDPSRQQQPRGGDHGPYKLLPRHRFVVRGVDPPTDKNRTIFSYTIKGKRLQLRLVSLNEPAFSPSEVKFDRMADRALTAFPYTKTG